MAKRCPVCGHCKQPKDFGENRSRPGRKAINCLACERARARQYRATLGSRQNVAIPEQKKCCRCGVTQYSEAFFRDRTRSDGLCHMCKSCRRVWMRSEKQRARRLLTNGVRKYRQNKCMPPWADKEAIEQVYKTAARATELLGELHQVDHIVPLQGDGVCGLHVHYNLRVIPRQDNLRKGNSMLWGDE